MALCCRVSRQVVRAKRPSLARWGLDLCRLQTARYSQGPAIAGEKSRLQYENGEPRRRDTLTGRDETSSAFSTKSVSLAGFSQWLHQAQASRSQWHTRRKIADSQAQPEHTRRVKEQLRRGPGNASQILIDCIASGQDVPQQTITLCLHHAFKRHYFNEKKDEGPMARATLKYILEDSNRWLQLLLDSADRSRVNLCYIAILEGLERTIQDLCMVEVNENEVDRKLTPQERHVWRGSLFTALVRAHTLLTPGKADSAIRSFFEVVARKKQRLQESGFKDDEFVRGENSGVKTLALWPGTMFIVKEISNGKLVCSDRALYERFEGFHRCERVKARLYPEQHAWHRASLALFRPNSPDHEPMVALLRKIVENHRTEQRDERNPTPGVLQQAWARRTIKQTHEIALHNGSARDAEWLTDTFGENLH